MQRMRRTDFFVKNLTNFFLNFRTQFIPIPYKISGFIPNKNSSKSVSLFFFCFFFSFLRKIAIKKSRVKKKKKQNAKQLQTLWASIVPPNVSFMCAYIFKASQKNANSCNPSVPFCLPWTLFCFMGLSLCFMFVTYVTKVQSNKRNMKKK